MQYIYVYSGCSPKKYKEYVESKGIRVQQQAQKYNQLLMEGIVENGVAVDAVSSRPMNRRVDKRLFFGREKDVENGITYHYVPFINYPVLRNISVFFGVFFNILFMKTQKERAMVCDALSIAPAFAALLACKLRGIRTVGIVTDVPCHRPSNAKVPMHERVNLRLMTKFDGYLLLTEQMNDIVNPKGRPYVVLEGHSDIQMAEVENTLENKYQKRVCLYAGTLRRVYGIEALVKGFIKADIPDTELHIYGEGDFRQELEALAAQVDSVKYMGIAPNAQIVQSELRCSLLVNPRPTDADYTKYSFPSKNMEYMASGTPVLTTRLPGMPPEYNEYVFLINEENEDGICEALKEIFAHTPEQLHSVGLRAKDFVMREKNNVVQAKKLIGMIAEEMKR